MSDYRPDRKATAAKNRAVVFSIIGFLFAGIVFGPLAIWQARVATARGVNARGWEILGWVGTFGAGIIILYDTGLLQPT